MIAPGIEFNNEIRRLGGRAQAQDFAYDSFIGKYWNGNTKHGKPQETTKGLKNLIPGKIYTFNYDPKHADELDFYDTQPVMLCLGQRILEDGGVLQLGINLNFIPFKLRQGLLDIVYKKFRGIIFDNLNDLERGSTTSQRALPINYAKATLLLEGTGFEFAIRSYYRSRMSKLKVVDYEDWHKILLIDTERIVGDTIVNIYNYYNNKRRQENNRFKQPTNKTPKPGRDKSGRFTKNKK